MPISRGMTGRLTASTGLSLLAIALLAAACAGPPAANGGTLRVVATTTQVGQVAGELGGDDITLTTLLTPGAEAHELEITPAQAAAIEDADIILVSGAGLETWLHDTLATIGGEDRVRDMSHGVRLRSIAADGVEESDPHYWLAAPNAEIMVRNVRDALSAAEPASASRFASRADAYLARLKQADHRIRDLMNDIAPANRGIVTNHDALGYFIDEYGLRFVGSIFSSLDVSAEPDPQQLAALAQTIRAEHVTAIFSESAVNPRLATAIAQETGAHVAQGVLYTDSLGPAGSDADTLDGMLIHDATVIHDALTQS
jgi:zinc/manganese transport system substrate-binding protein